MKPEQDAMLAEAGEEDEFIKCFDDITGKEMPWQVVKEAREKKLNTQWAYTDKAFEEEPMQIRSRIVAREFKKTEMGQTCMRELPRWKLSKPSCPLLRVTVQSSH